MKRSAAVDKGVAGVCLALAVVLFGCHGDVCHTGETECITNSVYRVCVPGQDGPEWVVSQCGDNEVCQSKSSLTDAGASSAVTDAGGDAGGSSKQASHVSTAASTASGDMCVPKCVLDQRECVSDSVARYCIAGGVWQLDMCDVGKRCVSGECVLSNDKGTVQSCMPGTKQCASDKVEKVCDADGTAWVFQDCPTDEICMDNKCVPDPKSSCDDGNRCLDNKTLVRCLGRDRGFELVKCEGDTYCSGGACRGANCAVGSTCHGTVNGQAQIRECTDGVNLRDTTCKVGEVCQQNPDNTAACVKRVCVPGATVCGDPNDAKVDATKYFSRCMTGVNSGVPTWVHGECVDNLTCDPAFVGGNNPCRQDCTPGAQRCAPGGTAVGVNDGFQKCGKDGMWGPVQRCNPGTDARLLCNIKPNEDPSALPVAVCATPVCNYAVSFPASGAEGTCEGGRISRCNDDGTLAAAEDCDIGICRNVTSTVTDDGRVPGACDTMVQCMDGEERCVDNGAMPTPRYQKCVSGLWSTTLETCANDTPCRDYLDDQGLSRKVCDAECTPGTRQCDGDGIQTCDAKGKWSDTASCKLGHCLGLANGDAACTVPCVPGTKRCAGANARASDGVHFGKDSEQVCGDDGQWKDPTACSGSNVCRQSESGSVLGCVECLGSDAPGGNTQGLADTRCDGANKTQACGADNTWQDSVTCSNSGTCVGPAPATCGACTGPDGTTSMSVCNLTNYQGVPRSCQSCTVSGTSTSTYLGICSASNYLAAPDTCGMCPTGPDGNPVAAPCTETSYRAVHVCDSCNLTTPTSASLSVCSLTEIVNAGGSSCADTDVGSSDSGSAWGGTSDCCLGAQVTYGDAMPSLTCNPSSWAGVYNCCAAAQQTYADSNPSFTCNPASWAGTSDCCMQAQQSYGDWNPTGTRSACSPAAWGGEAECCAAGRQGATGPSFAYCDAP